MKEQISQSAQEAQIPSQSFMNNFSDVRSTLEKPEDDAKSNRSKSAGAIKQVESQEHKLESHRTKKSLNKDVSQK